MQKLNADPMGKDISSLYMDDGYLFFNAEAVESRVEGDSVDLQIRLTEGPQTTIRNVWIEGNTRTSDEVILRMLRTYPGQKFSRANIIRSQRELLSLGYFNEEKTQCGADSGYGKRATVGPEICGGRKTFRSGATPDGLESGFGRCDAGRRPWAPFSFS